MNAESTTKEKKVKKMKGAKKVHASKRRESSNMVFRLAQAVYWS